MDKIVINRLIKSRRKTIGLEITPEGTLIVRAPHSIKYENIKDFISQKSKWITKHQKIAKKRSEEVKPKKFSDGEKFFYLGKLYPLRIVVNQITKLEFNSAFYLPQNKRKNARKLFISWYKKESRKYIGSKAEELSNKLNIGFSSIKITSAEKRWGSCSAGGNLNFPYRLVMAPEKVIEYVIVHELIHITDSSHSRSYWVKVEKAFPEYKECKKWLKDKGHLLTL